VEQQEIGEVVDWLVQLGLDVLDEAEMVASFCRKMCSLGIELEQVAVFLDTLHPRKQRPSRTSGPSGCGACNARSGCTPRDTHETTKLRVRACWTPSASSRHRYGQYRFNSMGAAAGGRGLAGQ